VILYTFIQFIINMITILLSNLSKIRYSPCIMAKDEIIARFEDVSFEYGANKPILKEVNFAIRRGLKITLMGQNGAGKSTLFGLLLEHCNQRMERLILFVVFVLLSVARLFLVISWILQFVNFFRNVLIN
jgi:ABC-type transport system involved in cytochrome bd biosynthesis fused ATPase/permease subunit